MTATPLHRSSGFGGLETDWRTIRGDQDREKLRLRYYDDRPDSLVFCEVKHQMTDGVVKYRGGLKREALSTLLAGEMPHAIMFVSPSPADYEALFP